MYARQTVLITKEEREMLRNLYKWCDEQTKPYSFIGFPSAIRKTIYTLQDCAHDLLHEGGYEIVPSEKELNEE